MKPQRFSLKITQPAKTYPLLSRLFRESSPFKIPFHLQSDWFLALFEAIQNAFQHGRAGEKKESVRVELKIKPLELEAKIFDRGRGFDLKGPVARVSSSAERGRGLMILRQLTDSLSYHRGKTENFLLLKKRILPPEKRYQFSDLLFEISHRLSEAPNLQKIYDLILKNLIEVFNVERASIMVYDPKEAALKVVAARGISPKLLKKIRVRGGEGVSGDVFQRSKPLLVSDLKKKYSFRPSRKTQYRSHSFISAPLLASPFKVGEENLGVINLTDKRDGRPFTKPELKLLSAIAPQAAAFIKIGRLMERLRTAEGVERELTVVREIQRKLLPAEIVSPENAEIAGEAILNLKGGGDYYDVVPDGDGIYLVVGDVAGHSLASALTMANFRSAFRILCTRYFSPRALLAELNTLLFDDLVKAEQFISVSLVRLFPISGKVVFAGAGSPPLLCYGEGRKNVTMIPSQGFPLGVQGDASYREESFSLSSGEGIVQCTDGVLDLPLKPEGVLGLEGVKKLILSHQHYSPQEMIQRLRKVLRKKISIRPPPDDITVLVTKML